MLGQKSADGKMSGNAQLVESHNSAHKKPAPKSEPPENEMGGGEAPEQVVAAHGPATEVHISHDHASGKHHVHSKHEDGHEHHSEHGSAEEAHNAAGTLAGASAVEKESFPSMGKSHTGPSAGYMG
jgi:hypothetical protein